MASRALLVYRIATMPGGETNDAAVLRDARGRCRRLIEGLRRDADALRPPSRRVAADVLAEGLAAHDRAAAAAEQLLARLNESLEQDPPPGGAA